MSASPSRRALHHIADQVLHVGFGASFGTLYGAALGGRRASLGKTVAFGVGVWVFGSFILLPSLKIVRPEWRANARELSINLAAHLAYAAAVALLVEEFEKQASLQPLAYPLSFHAHTG